MRDYSYAVDHLLPALKEKMMEDESHLPVEQQSLVFRLKKRAEIRRQIAHRKSVIEGKPDRIANLLEEAAREIQRLNAVLEEVTRHTKGRDNFQP